MILVIAEHTNIALKPATLNTISAAVKLNQPITILIAGQQCEKAAQAAAAIAGIKKVLLVDAPAFTNLLAENLANVVVKVAKEFNYILAPATTFGKNFMPRVAALLDVAQISDIVQVISPDTFVRPIYAGNALATVQSKDLIKVITVRTTAFTPAASSDTLAPIEKLTAADASSQVKFISHELSKSARPELTAARVIVAGGRGMQSGEKFKLLETLADCLGAAIGASRAAVDAGFVPNDYQVGQTGKVVAPQLYIAIGISGAIQHLAGMKDSKVIVAINKDPDAPIFQIADYGLVGDLFEIIPQLTSELDKVKGS